MVDATLDKSRESIMGKIVAIACNPWNQNRLVDWRLRFEQSGHAIMLNSKEDSWANPL